MGALRYLLEFLPHSALSDAWSPVQGHSPEPLSPDSLSPRAARLTSHGALAAGFLSRAAPGPDRGAVPQAAWRDGRSAGPEPSSPSRSDRAGSPTARAGSPAAAASAAPSRCLCPVCSQLSVLNADVETLPAPAAEALAAAVAAPITLASSLDPAKTFALHSNPTANHTIYLDFDGHFMASSTWENGGALQLQPFYSDLNALAVRQEIQAIWQRMAEDFAPFNVNVTTQQPSVEDLRKLSGSDARWGIRMAFTYNNNLVTGAPIRNAGGGGTAYIGSFNWNTDEVALGFNRGEYAAAETGSHEVGHTLSLYHDGGPGTAYYAGHGSGATSWGTIMGAPFIGAAENLTTWSKGDYYGANNSEDDLNIITSGNGFSYRIDDHGGSLATATALTGQSISAFGVIERTSDVDWFAFDTGAGAVSLSVVNAARAYVADGSGNFSAEYLTARGPNLDIAASLYNSSGLLVASSNPLDQITASFANLSLVAGRYYLAVEGVGVGAPLASPPSGYTDYGSLGQYLLSGTLQPVVPVAALLLSTTALSTSEAGASASFSVQLATAPSADVTVVLQSSDTGEVSLGTTSLTFTPQNWQTPQPVAVTGVDDLLVDGAQSVTVSLTASSADAAYNALTAAVTVVNSDNDVPLTSVYSAGSGALVANLIYQSAPTASASGDAALAAVRDSDNSRLTISEGTILVTGGSARRPTTSVVSALNAYQWAFNPVDATVFRFEGYRSANSENDGFRFELSTNGGSSWSNLLTVSGTGGDVSQSVTLANPLNGPALVRVIDTNRSSGGFIDTLFVDRIAFEGQITDLRPTLSVTATTSQAVESPSAAGIFTIGRSDSSADLTVAFSLGGSATPDNDFTLADAAGQPLTGAGILLPAGQSSVIVQVLPKADAIPESAETVQLTLADPGPGYRLSGASATVTIVDGTAASSGPFLSAAEATLLGTVSGTHTATHSADGNRQLFTEVLSGRSSTRTSRLEHQWRFDAITGATSFRITAGTSGDEGEGFSFSLSRDDGNSWSPLGGLAGNQPVSELIWAVPGTPLSGSVLLKVVDRDATAGANGLDQLSIDAMAFIGPTASPAPAALWPIGSGLPVI